MTLVDDQVPIYSEFGADPDLGELVIEFVDCMPTRIALMRAYLAARQWPELRRAAHQLKGAAGSYGFDELTQVAAQLEKTVSQTCEFTLVEPALQTLVDTSQRLRAGVPATSTTTNE